MKKLLIALSLALAATGAYAKEEKAATPQQNKMADCNKEAKEKDMKGDARKDFMKSCLSSKPAAEPKKDMTAQQSKMGDCNKEAKAKDLKGDARKAFMKSCLSNKPTDTKAATPATPATPAKPAEKK